MTTYYTVSGAPVVQSRGASKNIRDEFDLIAAGFVSVDTLLAPKASPTLTTPVINGYTEGVVTANTTATYTIALTGTIQILTLTAAAVTYTFPAAVAGKSFLLVQRQDATGSRTVVWDAAVRWPGGSAPTLTPTAIRADLFAFTCDGTYWYGRQLGNNYQ